MSQLATMAGPEAFATFGELLHYLRRRARLKQRDLAIATGYSEAQISRLEQNQRLPDITAVSALFLPALGLGAEPELAERLIALGTAARLDGAFSSPAAPAAPAPAAALTLEPIPAALSGTIEHPAEGERLRGRLARERHLAICGMAGVGKTTLAAAAAREHAAAAPVFWLTLTPQVTASAEALIVQLARFLQLQGQGQVAPLLSGGERPGAPLPLERQIGLIGAALIGCAARHSRPPLICLDNYFFVQYDQAVVLLLRHLIAATPVALLLITRETPTLKGVAPLTLGGMDGATSQALLRQLGGEQLPAALAERLLERTGGNPMLLRLAAGQLFDRGGPPERLIERLGATPQIATFLFEAVQQHLGRDAWLLLCLLAILGQPADLYDEALLELAQAEGADLGAATAELQRRLLIGDPAQAALQPLVRDHVLTSMVPDQALRRRLHLLAARWLLRSQDTILQAIYHHSRAGALDQAIALLAERAEDLRLRGQAAAAAQMADELILRVRAAADAPPDALSRLLFTRAELLSRTMRFAEAEENYRAARAAAASPASQALIGVRLAFSLMHRGQAREALRECDAARGLIPAEDAMLRLELAVSESGALQYLSRHSEVRAVVAAALPLLDRLRGAPQQLARLRATLHGREAYAAFAHRRLDDARAELLQAIAVADQSGLGRLADHYRGSLAHTLLASGDLAGATRLIESLLPRLRAAGEIFGLEYQLSLLMQSAFLRGDMGAARDALDSALALREALGIVMAPSMAEGQYLTVLIGLGRRPEARLLLGRLLARIEGEREGLMRELGYNLIRQAMLALLDGDQPAAAALLRRVLGLPAAAVDPWLRADAESALGVALMVAGQTAEAAALLAADPPAEAGLVARLGRGLALATLAALVADDAEARRLAALVADLAGSSGHRLYAGAAARLRAALAAPLEPARLPQLLWEHTRR